MLRKKMLRDVKQQKAQFLSVFLMCFLGLFIYSGIYSEWRGMDEESSQLYENCNLADAWIQGSFKDGAFLKQSTQVKAWEGRTLLAMQDVNQKDSLLEVYAVDEAMISSMQIQAGIPYEKDVQGIWLDQAYADAHHYQVGDTITLQMENVSISSSILGVGYHPEYVYARKDETSLLPDHRTFGFAILSKQAYPQLQNLPFNQLVVKGEGDLKTLAVLLPNASFQVITKSDHFSVQTMQEEIAQHRSIGAFFPVVFLLIAMLTTLNTMRKMVKNQRLQIGTLKALGFTRYRLYQHYLSHIVCLCIAGVVFGLLLGPLLIPPLIYDMQKTMYMLPAWQGHMDGQVLLVALVVLLCCIFSCYLAIHQELKETSASLLRPKIIAIKHHVSYESLAIWKRLSFYTQWNVRDIFRNAARSFMAIIGITGCSALLLCSLGAKDSITNMMDLQYQKLHAYETKLTLREASTQTDAAKLETMYDGEAVMEGNVQMRFSNEEKIGSLNVLQSIRFIKLAADDETPLPVDGIVLSKKLAERYNLQVGNEVTWKLVGDSTWVTTKIARITTTPLSQGITIEKAYYERLGLPYRASAVLSDQTNILEQPEIAQVQYRENLQKDMDTMMDAMQILIFILIFAAILLGSVVLYNFTSLSFFERIREMATLKVLGFNDNSVMRLTRSQNIQLCVISILLGIPLGYTMIIFMMSTLSEAMDIVVYVQPLSYVFASAFTLLITLVISQWMARKVKHIDMVSALKATE